MKKEKVWFWFWNVLSLLICIGLIIYYVFIMDIKEGVVDISDSFGPIGPIEFPNKLMDIEGVILLLINTIGVAILIYTISLFKDKRKDKEKET